MTFMTVGGLEKEKWKETGFADHPRMAEEVTGGFMPYQSVYIGMCFKVKL